MSVALNPYLSFRDNAREAMEFYQSVFGGNLNLRTFEEFHAVQDAGEENLIMHADLQGDNGVNFFASDTPQRVEFKPGNNISLSLSGTSEDDAVLRGYFEKLCDGGSVTMPLEKAIWGDTFGMCTDKFGLNWMINIAGDQPQQSTT